MHIRDHCYSHRSAPLNDGGRGFSLASEPRQPIPPCCSSSNAVASRSKFILDAFKRCLTAIRRTVVDKSAGNANMKPRECVSSNSSSRHDRCGADAFILVPTFRLNSNESGSKRCAPSALQSLSQFHD